MWQLDFSFFIAATIAYYVFILYVFFLRKGFYSAYLFYPDFVVSNTYNTF